MIDNFRHDSPSPVPVPVPVPERITLQRAFSITGSMTELNGEEAIIVRRERLRLRRIKSLSLIKSKLADSDGEIISGEDKCIKRKRTDESKNKGFPTLKKATISRLPSAPPFSLDQLLKNDVIIAGKTSCGEDRKREDSRRVTCWSRGSVSVIGRRREMEDAVAVEVGFLKRGLKRYDFFGVYDGHGGSRVAHECGEHLHKLVAKHVAEGGGIDYNEEETIDWEKVMTSSFNEMDKEVNKGGSAVAMTGSTAVAAVVGEEELVVANCGDSRAVLSQDGVAMALSDDHKPDRPDELVRIEVSGGKVINWNGHRVLGVLATSRSIGDHYLKPFVISEPEVRVIKRTDKDEFLILASDGLWDVISNDVACQIARKCLDGQMRRSGEEIVDENSLREVADVGGCGRTEESPAARAAAVLAELAIARGSRDNVSVIVIELKRSGRCNASCSGNCGGWQSN